jgi:hypothetical protein
MPLHRAVVAALITAASCRVDPIAGPSFSGAEEPEPETGVPSSPATSGGTGGTPQSGGAAALAATGGEAGSDEEPNPDACDGEPVTLDEIRSGIVLESATIAVLALVTSQKFLVSQSQTGSCLWGAFVGTSPVDNEPNGLLVVSYGDEATGEAPCAPGTDAIPDELEPGHLVSVTGRASSFVPSSCDGIVAAPQLIADARCPLELLGREAPVEPVLLPLLVATELARGEDEKLLRRWVGGLVRLENVSALPNDAGDGAVRPYGVVALAETELEVHADIEYGDLSGKGPRDAAKGLDFGYPTAFRSVTGLVHLDYCDYALAPRRRCEDFEPPSLDCR